MAAFAEDEKEDSELKFEYAFVPSDRHQINYRQVTDARVKEVQAEQDVMKEKQEEIKTQQDVMKETQEEIKTQLSGVDEAVKELLRLFREEYE